MTPKTFTYFDHAATTPCCEEAASALSRFASNEFANPSSSHALGQAVSRLVREARLYFADTFGVEPQQVIFTGTGTESDNLGIYGSLMDRLWRREPTRVICSATEHAAIKRSVQSLAHWGADVQYVGVDSQGSVTIPALAALLTPATALVSIHQANNITGACSDVTALASEAKSRVPNIVFHSDCVQAFGKMAVPRSGSGVDLISISGHKIEGPKGVGALIVLNRALLKTLRPQVWGGGQEDGFRSGTQNPGAIYGFFLAARRRFDRMEAFNARVGVIRESLRSELERRKLSSVTWNSPPNALPHVVSLSVPGLPAGPLAKLLEERGFMVSTGSACSSQKAEPEPVLAAMGLPLAVQSSAIRLSFSDSNNESQVEAFVTALEESIQMMMRLLGMKPQK